MLLLLVLVLLLLMGLQLLLQLCMQLLATGEVLQCCKGGAQCCHAAPVPLQLLLHRHEPLERGGVPPKLEHNSRHLCTAMHM
jgi:hypothetical protein